MANSNRSGFGYQNQLSGFSSAIFCGENVPRYHYRTATVTASLPYTGSVLYGADAKLYRENASRTEGITLLW